MKKLLAITTCALVLVTPMAVCAQTSPSAAAVVAETPAATTSSTPETHVEVAAAAASMSVAEYTNNAVVETPGLSAEDTKPVGQGGKVYVNGVATNMSITLQKVNAAVVKSAKTQAAGGTVLNVVNAKIPVAKGNTVTANFYVKGIVGTEAITAFQLVNGQWVPVLVKEVRADHIVLDLTQSGPIMFVQA